MSRFDRFIIVAISIVLMLVAVTNAYINCRQNEMIDKLYDYVYVLEANLETKCDRLTISLSDYKQEQSKVNDLMLNAIRNMVIGYVGGDADGIV